MIDRSTLDGRRAPPAPPGYPPPTYDHRVFSALRRPTPASLSVAPPPASRSLGPGEMNPLLSQPSRSIAGCPVQTSIVPPAHAALTPNPPQMGPSGFLARTPSPCPFFATAGCPLRLSPSHGRRFPLLHFAHATAAPEFAPPPSSSNVSQRPTAREDRVTPPWTR